VPFHSGEGDKGVFVCARHPNVTANTQKTTQPNRAFLIIFAFDSVRKSINPKQEVSEEPHSTEKIHCDCPPKHSRLFSAAAQPLKRIHTLPVHVKITAAEIERTRRVWGAALGHATPGTTTSCFAGRSANRTTPITRTTITSVKLRGTPGAPSFALFAKGGIRLLSVVNTQLNFSTRQVP
jgi:hypothetical protein